MNRFFYTLLHYFLLPLLLIRLFLRNRQSPGYAERWWQRLGHVPGRAENAPRPLWIHAVSVGETIAARPLVEALLKEEPGTPLIITGMTATGAERTLALFGEQATHYFAPYDLPHITNRFLKRLQPRALLIMETEMWPNWIAACEARRIPVALLNGRMSEKSAKGYLRFARLTRPMWSSLSWVAAQSEADARRFVQLGCAPERVSVTGSIKYDVSIPEGLPETLKVWRDSLAQSPVWVAGSTHIGEDELLLAAHAALLEAYPKSLLILVPRHPERFARVAELAADQGFAVQQRSVCGDQVAASTQVLIGDTMGELLTFYGLADWAYVGGSLVERGGQNPLEPALMAKPVIMGPWQYNFELICARLTEAGALMTVESSELPEALLKLAGSPELVGQKGLAAASVVAANRGALRRIMAGVQALPAPPSHS